MKRLLSQKEIGLSIISLIQNIQFEIKLESKVE